MERPRNPSGGCRVFLAVKSGPEGRGLGRKYIVKDEVATIHGMPRDDTRPWIIGACEECRGLIVMAERDLPIGMSIPARGRYHPWCTKTVNVNVKRRQ